MLKQKPNRCYTCKYFKKLAETLGGEIVGSCSYSVENEGQAISFLVSRNYAANTDNSEESCIWWKHWRDEADICPHCGRKLRKENERT